MNGEIDGHTLLLGFFADPAKHSKSPAMYNHTFSKLGINYAYLSFEVDADHIGKAVDAIRTLDMVGGNVSMPNKQAIIPYLDKLAPSAKLCNAVNTIVNDHGVLTGYTTDGVGFMQSLRDEGLDITGKKMTLAGASGAGTPIAIQAALDGVKEISIFNAQDRYFERAVKNVEIINKETDCHATFHHIEDKEDFKKELSESVIYCDATSVGMKPLDDLALVEDPSWFHEDMIVFDTVYELRETKLMRVAKKAGVKHILNGLPMLLEQRAAAFKLWTNQDMPVDYIREVIFKDEIKH